MTTRSSIYSENGNFDVNRIRANTDLLRPAEYDSDGDLAPKPGPCLRHSPTSSPFISLPAPYTRVIITPPRRHDVPHIVATLNDHAVKKWLDGLPFPYLEIHAEEWVTKATEQSMAVIHELRVAHEKHPVGPLVAVSGCPVGCLRRVEADGTEVFLGVIEFTRCGYPDVLNRQEQERLARLRNTPSNTRLPHSTAAWSRPHDLRTPGAVEKLGFKITNTVKVGKVTSAGELIDGFHVLLWEMGERGQP